MQLNSNSTNIPNSFFKASQQGVQKCIWVDNNFPDFFPEQLLEGFIVDSLFTAVDVFKPMTVFEQRGVGYFTEEEEAILFHREQVIEYINNLNKSTLQSCPINV